MRHFEFKSIADLSRDIRIWLNDLPLDIEVVVGLPRSGLLVANLISLHRHIPMTDLEGLISGRVVASGSRFNKGDLSRFLHETRRVLVVDDSVLSGRQLETARRRLASVSLPHDFRYAAGYVQPGQEHLVDFSYQALPYPRMFEWNLMHHPMLTEACMDIDGVLCRDPTEAENDDGAEYSKFLETVAPLARPAFPIGTLVTCRLEKYRSATEGWLARNMIRYRNLVMMPYSSKAERIAANRHAAFKAEAYATARARIFIESNVRQAQEIADLTARPVVSTDRMKLCTPRIRSKTDIVDGLRKAGSLPSQISWLRTNRRSILSWVGRRRAARRKR